MPFFFLNKLPTILTEPMNKGNEFWYNGIFPKSSLYNLHPPVKRPVLFTTGRVLFVLGPGIFASGRGIFVKVLSFSR